MSIGIVFAIVAGVFFFLLLIGTPIAFTLAGSGAVGILLLSSQNQATSVLGGEPYTAVASYSLSIIPLYILLGAFALHGRLAERVYRLGARLLHFLPGGLGIATIAACAGFAAVSGSSVATAASLGKVSVGEMRQNGYPAGFAGAIVAIGGTLGILIPPSIALVMYGVLADESISALLAAGIIPGVMSAVIYAVFIGIVALRLPEIQGVTLSEAVNQAAMVDDRVAATVGSTTSVADHPRPSVSLVAAAPEDLGESASEGSVAKTGNGWRELRAVAWLGAIFAAIMVGLFTGLMTVIESAAAGALVAIIMLLVENFREGVVGLVRRVGRAVVESASLTSMVFGLLIGATILSTFFVMSRVPFMLAESIGNLDVPPIVVVIAILVLLIPMGMFLETMSVLIIVVPLVHPIVTELGFDGIWFAILFVMLLEIGLVTPPVGMNVFVVSATAEVPVESVFKSMMWFLIPAFAAVIVVLVFPEVALWLPSLVSG